MSSAEFRFVFADKEDIFFSRLMLKLDFEQYLYLKMQKDGFQYVYHFDSVNNETVRVCCENYAELKKYCERAKKGIFKKSFDIPDKKTVKLHPGNARMLYGYEHPKKKILDNLEGLLTEPCAFVFSMKSFHDIFTSEDIAKLDRLLSKNRYNKQKILFLIVDVENYDGQLPYLPESVLPEVVVSDINHDRVHRTLCEKLEARGIRCERWSAFRRAQIARMIHRTFLHFSIIDDGDNANKISAYLYQHLVEEGNPRIFQIMVNNQRDLFQKILLDREYLKMLQATVADNN